MQSALFENLKCEISSAFSVVGGSIATQARKILINKDLVINISSLFSIFCRRCTKLLKTGGFNGNVFNILQWLAFVFNILAGYEGFFLESNPPDSRPGSGAFAPRDSRGRLSPRDSCSRTIWILPDRLLAENFFAFVSVLLFLA